MKTFTYILFAGILLVSCNKSNEKSDAYGNFEATEITVSSQVAGEILSFNINEGQQVNAADLIGIIDTVDFSLKYNQFLAQRNVSATKIENIQAQIALQEKQKENLLKDQARIQKMYSDGAATQKQLDDINGSVDVMKRQLNVTQTQLPAVNQELKAMDLQLRQIESSLSKCRITAPVQGTVLTKYAEAGEITAPGKALFKLANLSQMELKVYVSGDQLSSVKIGANAEILFDSGKDKMEKTTGIVSWISDKAEFTPKIIQTKQERINLVYAVKVLVKNDGRLKIGMPAEVKFIH